MALGSLAYLGDGLARDLILGALGFAFAYNFVVIGLIRARRVRAAFTVGFVLDHLVLLCVWWVTVALGDAEAPNDLYLVLFPILAVGVIRAGWPYGLAYSTLLVGAIGWLEWRYEPAGAYEAGQLPLRLGFLSLVAVLVAVLVYQLQRAKRTAELHSETMDAIQGSMADGLLVVDGDGRVVFCNPTARSLFGDVDSDGVVGLALHDLADRALASGQGPDFVEAVREQALNRRVETVYVGAEVAQPVHFAVTGFPIEMGGASMTGVLMRDVTEQWELEQLQYRFVSIAAHELRTPLTSVMGFSELLQTRKTSDEQRQKWVGYINAEAHRLTAILDQILNVANIKSGETDALQIGTMDVGALIAEAARELASGAGNRTIAVEVDAAVPVIITDVGKVKRVVLNLISNAVKYSPAGSDVRVTARSEPSEAQLVIDVTDRGIGIAERDWHRLFASFSRIPRADQEIVRGAGLGLFISRRLARSLGGDVWLEHSVPGQGSTFRFVVPLDGGAFANQAA